MIQCPYYLGRRKTVANSVMLTCFTAGSLLQPPTFPPCSLEQFSKVPDISDAERADYLGFIKSMIALDPAQRPDAKTLLDSKWLRQRE